REFRLTVGIQGGVIFDELSGNTNYWAGRKDEETLGYVGGRIDFAVIALLGSAGSVSTDWGFGGGLRQDLGGGFYLSDSVDYNPQFIGATILYARCEIQYQARVIFGLDAGIGMAYGNGSKDDPHQPLYFFDWEVEHSSVALAGLLGLSLDFFGGSSSKVGWGIGLYTLFATSSGDNTRHGAIILEPDLHIIFAF
ncbi:MAG: hypothetical protein J6A01_06445, partial [Proteobacteria bacterium]|nr:hypothetical protein [Pseudomonadota bacterium]